MSKKEGGEGKVGGYGETFEDEDVRAQFRESSRWYAGKEPGRNAGSRDGRW